MPSQKNRRRHHIHSRGVGSWAKIEITRNEAIRRKKKIRDEAKLAEQELALKGGCVTPCTETEMGAVADIQQGEFRQGKERVNQVEVVVPDKTIKGIIKPVGMRDKWRSVIQNVKVKEGEKRVVNAKQIAESLQAIRATSNVMRQFRCHCKSCKVRPKSSNNRRGGR